jgi:hypothetical protein
MITYWRWIHCHWVKVTTTRAVWAGLRHIVGPMLACSVVASAPLPAYPYLPFEAPQAQAPAPEAIWYPYPGTSPFEAIAAFGMPVEVGALQVGAGSPLAQHPVPEPASLLLMAPALLALAWRRTRRPL